MLDCISCYMQSKYMMSRARPPPPFLVTERLEDVHLSTRTLPRLQCQGIQYAFWVALRSYLEEELQTFRGGSVAQRECVHIPSN